MKAASEVDAEKLFHKVKKTQTDHKEENDIPTPNYKAKSELPDLINANKEEDTNRYIKLREFPFKANEEYIRKHIVTDITSMGKVLQEWKRENEYFRGESEGSIKMLKRIEILI